jgi:methylglutaconyl-CoA hydratase
LSAERFDASAAQRFGLIHELSSTDRLDTAVEAFVTQLLGNSPHAMASSKELVAAVADRAIDESVLADVARRIALQRASGEGREGVAAFLEKRPPAWVRG